jgi:hypothetical protein
VADAGGRRNEGAGLEFSGRPVLAYVLGPVEPGKPPIFIVLNAAPEAIAFKLPKLSEYKSWQQLLNTADVSQAVAEFASGSDAKASPRSVLAFAGSA